MEAKAHNELSSFLAQHKLEDSISNIDDIVLSYLVGVVELISLGDDGVEIEDVMDMLNAYLPGFDQIGRSQVIEWMFGLASRLVGTDKESVELPKNEDSIASKAVESNPSNGGTHIEIIPDNTSESSVHRELESQTLKDRKFPNYEWSEKSLDTQQNIESSANKNKSNSLDLKDNMGGCKSNLPPGSNVMSDPPASSSSTSSTFPSLSVSSSNNRHQPGHSKRKGRQLSCSSQESQDDSVKNDGFATEDESRVRTLLEMFPAACTMEACHCLHLSDGDMDRAAQLIIDRQEAGQAITTHSKASSKKNHKMKKTIDYKLDDESIKSCVLQKYSFVDTEEDKKTYRPPPPKGEAKKLVRYRDGQVVSMKGERFSEVKKKETDDMKSTYVSLKPARKYRFH